MLNASDLRCLSPPAGLRSACRARVARLVLSKLMGLALRSQPRGNIAEESGKFRNRNQLFLGIAELQIALTSQRPHLDFSGEASNSRRLIFSAISTTINSDLITAF